MPPVVVIPTLRKTRSTGNLAHEAKALEKEKEALRKKEHDQISQYSAFVHAQNEERYRELDKEIARHRRGKRAQLDSQGQTEGSDGGESEDDGDHLQEVARPSTSDAMKPMTKEAQKDRATQWQRMGSDAAVCNICSSLGTECYRGAVKGLKWRRECSVKVGDTTFGRCQRCLLKRERCTIERGSGTSGLRNVKEVEGLVGVKRKRVEEGERKGKESEASASSRPEKKLRRVTLEEPLDDDPSPDARQRRLSEKGHAQKIDQISKDLSRLLSEVDRLNRGRL
ncbi:hypothetical protein FA13DRAFT_1799923 [Coprinellus micaceus]|uniref:Uncharacterized protein n=1 Tax=Coprinellus micaceus TaxID=71717 RepID=A0A4Y7SHT3_COPMI|nr:hypothetical protein FA13DRAFT_1799923 [Coprinellus micaceus]